MAGAGTEQNAFSALREQVSYMKRNLVARNLITLVARNLAELIARNWIMLAAKN